MAPKVGYPTRLKVLCAQFHSTFPVSKRLNQMFSCKKLFSNNTRRNEKAEMATLQPGRLVHFLRFTFNRSDRTGQITERKKLRNKFLSDDKVLGGRGAATID